MDPTPDPAQPYTPRRSTGVLLVVGFVLATLAMFGKSMTAATQADQINYAISTVAFAWVGVVLVARHRRWAKSFKRPDRADL